MKFFDNINDIVKDDLLTSVKENSKLSVAASCFSIYALMFRQISSATPKVSSDKELMTEKEVCYWIGKSKATLYCIRTYYRFPHTKIGGQKAIIYSRKAIDAYFKENERKESKQQHL